MARTAASFSAYSDRRRIRHLHRTHSTAGRLTGRLCAGSLLLGALLLAQPVSPALAANPAVVNLGTSGAFTVLAGSTVTSTGDSEISADAGIGGNLGVSPGTAITGFPPGVVLPPGTIHANDAVAGTAKLDAGTAYTSAAGRTPDRIFDPAFELAGETLFPGVYRGPTSLGLTGDLTLDGQEDPDAVFIFQAGSTFISGSASRVLLTNGAQACNVFWQIGSSATLGANSLFNGTILASASISAGEGAAVEGRLLADSGAVTLINNKIHTPACAPESGVAQAPVFGALRTVAPAAFLITAGVLAARRRLRPATVR